MATVTQCQTPQAGKRDSIKWSTLSGYISQYVPQEHERKGVVSKRQRASSQKHNLCEWIDCCNWNFPLAFFRWVRKIRHIIHYIFFFWTYRYECKKHAKYASRTVRLPFYNFGFLLNCTFKALEGYDWFLLLFMKLLNTNDSCETIPKLTTGHLGQTANLPSEVWLFFLTIISK